MKQKVTSSESPFPYIPMTSLTDGVSQRVADDLYCLPIQIVNVCFIGNPQMEKEWVLVDTGMPKSAEHIYDFLSDSFGKVTAPRAILLTHGHFDHVGTVIELSEAWDVPVYAHEAELPFLTGEVDYPEPDGSVEGGLIAKLSPLFPNEGINLSSRIKVLPQDGSIPFLADWKWIHTPGHSPGHVSFFREQDRALIAGDAFVTVRQDSLYKVLTQTIEISGPPRYLTTDWPAAWESVRKLAALEPSIAVTGHGLPMFGADLRDQLGQLVEHFADRAIPDQAAMSTMSFINGRGREARPPASSKKTQRDRTKGYSFPFCPAPQSRHYLKAGHWPNRLRQSGKTAPRLFCLFSYG